MWWGACYFSGKQDGETFCDCETEIVTRKERNGNAERSNGESEGRLSIKKNE